jgi:hypothetical protein
MILEPVAVPPPGVQIFLCSYDRRSDDDPLPFNLLMSRAKRRAWIIGGDGSSGALRYNGAHWRVRIADIVVEGRRGGIRFENRGVTPHLKGYCTFTAASLPPPLM